MKIKDLKNKNGKGLLPKKMSNEWDRNFLIDDLGNKNLSDYVEIDVEKVATRIQREDIVYRMKRCEEKDTEKEKEVLLSMEYCRELAQAIAKECPLKTKEK